MSFFAAALDTCRGGGWHDGGPNKRERRESNLHLYFMAIMRSRTVCLQMTNQRNILRGCASEREKEIER